MRTSRALLLALLATGCTSTQLERSTINQAHALTDLHYQQVLENVALTVTNPSALPSFALASSGTAQITDSLTAGGGVLFNSIPGIFWAGDFNPSFTRNIQGAWHITPVLDPDKLSSMRVAHQIAAGYPRAVLDGQEVDRLTRFLGRDAHSAIPSGWYCLGKRRRDVPSCAAYWAHYKGTYVWVMPEQMPGLTQFTLHMMDMATAAPQPKRMIAPPFVPGGIQPVPHS